MAYTNLMSAKLSLGIAPSNSMYDAQINGFINFTTDIINEWIGRDLHYFTATEYYCGNAQQYLALNRRPLHLTYQTGTLNGTTSVTGLADTSKFIVGMPVVGTNPSAINNPSSPAIVPGTTVASIVSSTAITLSQAANVSGSQTLFFGMSIWLDSGAFWNSATSNSYTPFAASTQLTPGQGFAIDVDQPDGTSRSGLIYNINGYWPEPFTYQVGRISPLLGPGNGNIKVQYTAGYATIPGNIQLAANLLIAKIRQISPMGQMLESESVKDYSYKLATITPGVGLITSEISQLLSNYRNQPVA